MYKITKQLFLLVLLAAFCLPAGANKDSKINLPRGTVEGYLDNGLHYIIMPNALPRHGIEMRLVMKVGSLQENDQQKGGAHFLEHMSFSGTKHFPQDAWVDYFERLGMKYGRDINAFTGYDRTIYWLSLPVADFGTQVMDSTLLAVRDILDGVSFEPQLVEQERGVIKEELRGYSTGDDFYSLKIGDGRYILRMPLGTEQDIETISRNQLLNYYHQWYLPQNACLVVVGNVDAQDMQKRIQATFSSIAKGQPTPLGKYPLTYKKGITLHEVKDTVGTSSKLEFIIPHEGVVSNTIVSTALKEQYRLLISAISKRLAARGIRCDISDAWYLATQNHFSFSVEGKGKQELKEKMTQVLGAFADITKKGFGKEELADYVTEKVNRMKADTIGFQSGKWCDDFVDYIISGDRYVAWDEDMEKVKLLVSNTSSSQLQKLFKTILNEGRKSLLVAYQNNAGKTESFSESELQQLWLQGLKTRMPAYTYQRKEVEEKQHIDMPACLSATHPNASASIVSKRRYEDIGVSEYQLANGLRLVMRPTTDKDSTIYIAMHGRGGVGDLSKQDYPLLKDAVSYVDMGGLAHISTDQLTEVMQAEGLSMSVGIADYWHQVLASAPTDKAQELMNLVYEKITAPGKSYEDFKEVRDAEIERFGKETLLERLLKRDINRMLSRRVDSLVCNMPANSGVKIQKEDLNRLNLDSMINYYTSLFANPQQTTLIVTGNLNEEQVLGTIVNTFARLKPSARMTRFEDKPSNMPKSPYKEAFENDVETQTVLNYIYSGNYKPGLRQSLMLKLMRDVMQNRLLSILREKMNIVYSPYADLYYAGVPQAKYNFWLEIALKNENRDKAIQALDRIIKELQTSRISEGELNKLKMSFLVTKRKSLSDDAPAEWKNILTTLLQNGESLEDFDNYSNCLKSITTEDIRKGFEEYVRPERVALLYKGNPF